MIYQHDVNASYTVVSAGDVSIVEPSDLRKNLELYDTEYDVMLMQYQEDAIDYIETAITRQLVTATIDLTLDRFPSCIELRKPPIQSVTSITYIDTAGDTQTLSDTLYEVDVSGEPGRIVPAYGQSWPSTRYVMNAVTVRFVCGWLTADEVPEGIKSAIKLHVKGNFNGCDMMESVDRCLRRYKWGAFV